MKTKRFEILGIDNVWYAEVEVSVDENGRHVDDTLYDSVLEIMRDNELVYDELVIVEVASFITFKDLEYDSKNILK